MIRLEHVYKSYENGTQALKDLSITIEDGEFAFLVDRPAAANRP
jgi:cell division transport system ATP-binding protein